MASLRKVRELKIPWYKRAQALRQLLPAKRVQQAVRERKRLRRGD